MWQRWHFFYVRFHGIFNTNCKPDTPERLCYHSRKQPAPFWQLFLCYGFLNDWAINSMHWTVGMAWALQWCFCGATICLSPEMVGSSSAGVDLLPSVARATEGQLAARLYHPAASGLDCLPAPSPPGGLCSPGLATTAVPQGSSALPGHLLSAFTSAQHPPVVLVVWHVVVHGGRTFCYPGTCVTDITQYTV